MPSGFLLRGFAVCVPIMLGVALSDCAYVTAVPAKPGSHVSGIRIYDVKPILVITADAYTIHMIPNYNRAYALKFGAFLAKNTTTVAMSNGIVSNVTTALDSTEALKLLTLFAQRLLPPEPRAQATSGGSQRGSVFGVYEFRFADDGELIGLIELPLNVYPPLVAAAAAAGSSDTPPAPVIEN